MNLYLISERGSFNFLISSHVVCAENKEEAMKMVEENNEIYFINKEKNSKYFTYHLGSIIWIYCKYLGETGENIEKGIILSHYNERQ